MSFDYGDHYGFEYFNCLIFDKMLCYKLNYFDDYKE
jgi:hypothetical protein